MAGLRVPEKRSGGMPQYRQQPAYNTTPGANLGARLSDSAGGIAAQGAQAGWQAVINTGKAVQGAAKVGFDLYTEYSRTKAQEAYNKFQESMQADLYGENGIFNRKGENALSSVADAEKLMRERAGEFEKNLGDMGKKFFQKQIGTYGRQLLPQVQRHATSEFNTWQINTQKTRAELAKNAALENYNDPEVFAQKLQESGLAIMEIARISGWSREQTELATRENASGIYLEVGNAALSRDNVKQAQSVLASGMLTGEDKIRLEAAIRNKQEQLEAKARAEAERARAAQERAQNQAAAQLGISLFQQYGNNAESVQEQIGKIKDPVMQGKAIQSYLTQQGLHERLQQLEEVQQKAAAYNDGVSQTEAVLKDTNLTNDEKNTRLAEIQAGISDPKTRKSVADYQDFLINGVEAPVNDRIFADAQSYAAQPGVTPDMVTARFSGSLPPSALQKVRKNADDQQWKQEEQLLKDELISTLKNRFNYRDADAQSVYRLILSQLNGTVGYEARRKKALSLAVEITVDKGRWSWGKDIPAASLARYQEQGYQFSKVVEIPETVKPMIDEALSVQGKELTDENRKALYQNYLKQQGK